MLFLRKHYHFVLIIVLLVACTFSSACTAWHTTSLEPQRFSSEEGPERARLTFSDGTRLTARHPVLVGDSLVWVHGSGEAPRDSARSAVLASSIRQVQVHGVDAGRTIALLVLLGGTALVIKSLIENYVQSID